VKPSTAQTAAGTTVREEIYKKKDEYQEKKRQALNDAEPVKPIARITVAANTELSSSLHVPRNDKESVLD